MTTTLALQQIRRDGGTQPRDRLSESTVANYVEALQRGGGEALPPVTVFFDGAEYWLADGFHRVAAHEALGRPAIEAQVHQGTRRDAILHSSGANAQHGLPRSNEDKRRAVLTLLRDPEWAGWSNGKIAAACRVSDDLVRKLRASLDPERAGDGERRSGDDVSSRRDIAGDDAAVAEERAGGAAAEASGTSEVPTSAGGGTDHGAEPGHSGRAGTPAPADDSRMAALSDDDEGEDTEAAGAPSFSRKAADAIPAQALRSEMTLAQIGAIAWRAYEQHHAGLAQAARPAPPHFVDEDRRRCAGWFVDAVREMLDDIFDGPYTSAAPAIRAEIHRAMEQLAAIIGEPVDPAPGVHTVGDLAKRLNATGLPWPTVAERGGVEPAAFKRLLEGAPERRLSRPEKRHVGRLFQTPPTDAITAARAAVRVVS